MALLLGELSVLLTAKTDAFKAGLADASKALKKAGDSLESFGKRSLVAATVTGGFGLKMALMADAALNVANRMKSVFGSMSTSVDAWARKSEQALGGSRDQLRAMATSVGEFLQPLGLSSGAIADMSEKLTSLAADAGAARGIDKQMALEALTHALEGSTRGLRELGISVTEADLQNFAYSKGIFRSVSSLDEATKAQLVYGLILQRTSGLNGYAASVADTLGGRIERMKAHFVDLATDLGARLIPVFDRVVGFLDKLINGFTNMSSGTKDLVLRVGVIGTALALLGAVAIPVGAVVSALGTIGGILAAVISPELLLAAVAVGALVAAFGAIKEAWDKDFLGIREGVASMGDFFSALSDYITNEADNMVAAAEKIWKAFKDKDWKSAMGAVSAYNDQGQANAQQFVGRLQGQQGPQMPSPNAGAAADLIRSALSGVKDTLISLLSTLKDSFVTGASALLDLIPADKRAAFSSWVDSLVAGFKDTTGAVGKLGDHALDAADGLSKVAKQAASSAFLSAFGRGLQKGLSAGLLGDVVQGATDGAASGGGVPGAVAGGLAALLTASATFQKILTVINGFLQVLADTLGDMLGPILPILDELLNELRPILAVLAPLLGLLQMLNPGLIALNVILRLLEPAMRVLFEAIRSVALGILEAIKKVLKAVHAHSHAVDDAINSLTNTSYDSANAVGQLGSAAAAAAAALLNVPAGFKVEAYRFAAEAASGRGGIPVLGAGADGTYVAQPVGMGGATSGGGAQTHRASVGGAGGMRDVYLVALNPQELFRMFKEEMRRKGIRQTGQTVPMTSRYIGVER